MAAAFFYESKQASVVSGVGCLPIHDQGEHLVTLVNLGNLGSLCEHSKITLVTDGFGGLSDSGDTGKFCDIDKHDDLVILVTLVTLVHYGNLSVEIKHVKWLYHQTSETTSYCL